MSEEGRLPDLFQYGKELAIVLLLFWAFRRRRQVAYLVWALLFGYILVDDALSIHEGIGFLATDAVRVPTPFGLHPAEVAQLSFLAIVGAVMLLVSFLLIWHTRAEARRVSLNLTLLLLIAAFFGFIVDIFQSFVMEIRFVSGLTKIAEDGGEMIVISVITWYSYLLATATPPDLLGPLTSRLRRS